MPSSSPLNGHSIRSALTTKWLGHRIELRDQVGSTNREAVTLAQSGVEDGTAVLADSQTEGHGRLSRRWFSPPGINVYCSIVVRKSIESESLSDWLSWLPLITAVASAEAIETVTGRPVDVKWPNDLLISDRKVGGILCESGTTGTIPFQIIGLGINVNGVQTDFPKDLQQTAVSLRIAGGKIIDRNWLISQLLNELEVCLDEMLEANVEKIALAYRRRCSTIGKLVKATKMDGSELFGLAETIGIDGSLKIIQRPFPADGRPPAVHHLRAADVVHLRS